MSVERGVLGVGCWVLGVDVLVDVDVVVNVLALQASFGRAEG